MNIGSIFATTRIRIIAAMTTTILTNGLAATTAWQNAHGDSANTGFARVDTAPANNLIGIAEIGPVAPHANPVIGPDGTVYIGNLAGELRAFHPDGKPYWTRKINSDLGTFLASPVVGDDGSIYIVSTINTYRKDSILHKFSPGGGWLFWKAFPEQFANTTVANTGATNAPPNIWRFDGKEAIIVPVKVASFGGEQLKLLAFSTNGAVLADQMVTSTVYEITGGSDLFDWVPSCLSLSLWNDPVLCYTLEYLNGEWSDFLKDPQPQHFPLAGAGFPLPGVAIRPGPKGGAPSVIVSDGRQDKVAYSFSPQSGFSEVSRTQHLRRKLTTPPVVQPNGNTVLGTADGLLTFAGPDFALLPSMTGLGILTAAPTRLGDGRLALVERSGAFRILSGNTIQWQADLAGESVASAAASCTHLFVASEHELATFDVRNMAKVGTWRWARGGLAAPVIGPAGQVYAITADVLFAFAPPANGGVVAKTQCDQLAPPSGPGIGQ